jgi:hypothetical protein
MTPPNKPEWIELAEADAAPQGKKSTRALPALVLAAALSIVGAGALVGQSGAKVPADLTEQGLSVLASATPASPSSAAKSLTGAAKQPAIATMPTGGDDDEDDEHDRHGRGDEDEDDEEGDDD